MLELSNDLGWISVAFVIFNTYMLLWSLFVNRAVFRVFLTLEVTFILLAIGHFSNHTDIVKAGGIAGVVTAACRLVRLGGRGHQRHGVPEGAPDRRTVEPESSGVGNDQRVGVRAGWAQEEAAVSETREEGLSALLHETRTFPPPEEFAKEANAQPGIYAEAEADPLAFWASQAKQLTWDTPWTDVLEWNLPFARWFVGGKLNVAVNCVDRHVAAGLGDRVAFHWEGEPGDTRTITYDDLLTLVSQAANGLTELGVRAGDKVAIYMPMIPETVVAMLACARLGAPHTVVFGGFSADALRGRILDCDAHFVITADGGYRRGPPSALEAGGRRGGAGLSRRRAGPRRAAHRPGGRMGRSPRRVVARPGPRARPRRTRPRPSTPSTRSTSCTPAARRRSPRASSTRAAGT